MALEYSDQTIALSETIFLWIESAPDNRAILQYASQLVEKSPGLVVTLFSIIFQKLVGQKNIALQSMHFEHYFESIPEDDQLLIFLQSNSTKPTIVFPDGTSINPEERYFVWAESYAGMWNRVLRFGSAMEAIELQKLLSLLLPNYSKIDIKRILEFLVEDLKLEARHLEAVTTLTITEREKEISDIESLHSFPSILIDGLMDENRYEDRNLLIVRLIKILVLLEGTSGDEIDQLFLAEALWIMQRNALEELVLSNLEAKRTSVDRYSSPETYAAIRSWFNGKDLRADNTLNNLRNYSAGFSKEHMENFSAFIYSFLKGSFYIRQVLGPFSMFELIKIFSSSKNENYTEVINNLLNELTYISESDSERLRKLLEVIAYLVRTFNLIQYV